jgi:hypothetical protein
MKFYVATKYIESGRQQVVAALLEGLGLTQTHDWTVNKNKDGSIPEEQRLSQDAQDDLNGVRQADLVVVLLEGGLGTHAELGGALILGKMVILVGDQRMWGYDCVFYHHPGLIRIPDDENYIKNIRQIVEKTLSYTKDYPINTNHYVRVKHEQ